MIENIITLFIIGLIVTFILENIVFVLYNYISDLALELNYEFNNPDYYENWGNDYE